MTEPQWLTAWAADDQDSALEVIASGAAADAVAARVPKLVADRVAGAITAHDATVWGAQAQALAAVRLGWVDLPETSHELVAEVERLRAELAADGIDRVLLCGMGGASLAAEVIARAGGVRLAVLDGTHPDQVRAALDTDLDRTVVVLASKSGTTVETDCHRLAFEAAFTEAGLDPSQRLVAVTDAGSPLERIAHQARYRAVFRADPHVGGPFSALSAFGLVPAGLAGADVEGLLESAAVVADLLADDGDGNPGLVLGAALGGTDPLRDKVVLVDEGSGLTGFGDWAEHLLAESTGKQGGGLLPVVVEGPRAPELGRDAPDQLVVRLVPAQDDGEFAADAEPGTGALVHGAAEAEVSVAGPLGAQFLLWEYAAAVAGRLRGVDPFDRPDVQRAMEAAQALLRTPTTPQPAALIDGAVELRATPGLLDGVTDLPAALAALLRQVPPDGYLAVAAYLDRGSHAATAAALRPALAARLGRPVTFGWGPRFLHTTGQFHHGGPAVGVHLQITGQASADVEVPGMPFSFGRLLAAQADGDAEVLAGRGRPMLRVHLKDGAAGWNQLLAATGVQA